jgi:lipid-binding SYLF domain-containing protein
VEKAANIALEMSAANKGIPQTLLQGAEAVAVFPGEEGKGLVSTRLADGRWTAPVFVQISESKSSVAFANLVLVFTNGDALRTLEEGTRLKLGYDASIVPGPAAQTAESATDRILETAIYTYTRSSDNAFEGVTLDGGIVDVDLDANHQVYGPDATAKKIFLSQTLMANTLVKPFIEALNKMTVQNKVTQR